MLGMEEVDALIIGSGYGGSIPALRLAEAGMHAVVLERGARMRSSDFRQSDDIAYLQSVIDYVISSGNIGFRTGKLLGGASNNMDGAFFRAPSESLAARDGSGRRFWPEVFSRSELDRYYALAERMLSIRQMTWAEIPKGGGLFAKMCDNAGASCDLALMNYTDCVQCGFCSQGCTFDKKMTLGHNYIPAAEAKGAEFRTGAQVTTIAREGSRWIAHYLQDGEQRVLSAPRAIIAGGGIHTPALLLRSKLPGLSAHLGENFNTNGEHTFIGILPEDFDDLSSFDVWKGMDNAGLMSFHFWESDQLTLHPGAGLEPSILGANLAAPGHPLLPARSFGLDYKRFAEKVYRHRMIAFAALGIAPGHLAVTVRPDGSPDLVARDRVGHDAYLERLDARVRELAAPSGVTLIDAIAKRYSGMTSAHLLSSCRMAERKEDGVVSPSGEVFGAENLWVCDASAVPYALGVNPALTIAALAERTAQHIIGRG